MFFIFLQIFINIDRNNLGLLPDSILGYFLRYGIHHIKFANPIRSLEHYIEVVSQG